MDTHTHTHIKYIQIIPNENWYKKERKETHLTDASADSKSPPQCLHFTSSLLNESQIKCSVSVSVSAHFTQWTHPVLLHRSHSELVWRRGAVSLGRPCLIVKLLQGGQSVSRQRGDVVVTVAHGWRRRGSERRSRKPETKRKETWLLVHFSWWCDTSHLILEVCSTSKEWLFTDFSYNYIVMIILLLFICCPN